MHFLKSDWILTCDVDFTIIQDGVIVFDEKIIDIDTQKNIEKKYPNCTISYEGENSVIMAGLINAHTHLEFSGNKTTLKYGNFVNWLFSVIEHREEVIEKGDKSIIDAQLRDMINCGTTTIGAISSYGFDLQSCVESKLNVVYFTEVLGSKPEMIDTLLQDFKEKFNISKKYKSNRFIPAIAIHSPYSTHPFLIREALNFAKGENVAVSAHFMESKAENDWLNYSKGEFITFFQDLLGQKKSLQTPIEFLNSFKNLKKLSFTHCVYANKNELEMIRNLNASIINCPTSNRLLGNGSLDFNHLKDINLAIGTDGLSSNYSLNLFLEMKNSLFINKNTNLEKLAEQLILASTKGAAIALGMEHKGSLEIGKDADLIIFKLPEKTNIKDVPTMVILHTTKTDKTFIKGQNAHN